MRNKSGKVSTFIIILAIFILIAALPWYFIVSRHLGLREASEKPSHELIHDEDTDADELSGNEHEEVPEPSPDISAEPDTADVHDGGNIDIRSHNPQLFGELNNISSQADAVAVALVYFDGRTGEFFNYEYGHAELETRRSVNIDTKFRVASLSKLTTAICALILVDEGLLDLDTDISVYLGYEVVNTYYPASVITTRMLLQHTSSIFDSGAFDASRNRDSSESIRHLIERGGSFRRSQPGTRYEYVNFGYAIIGAICENVSGKTLDSFARERIFEPLGIDASYLSKNLHDTENIAAVYNERHLVTRSVEALMTTAESSVLGHDLHLAQGSLMISAVDYAKILVMLGNGGILGNVRILSQNAVDEMHDANVDADTFRQGLAIRYTFGDFIPGEGFYWHTGSAFGLFSQYIQTSSSDKNQGVVVVMTGATTDLDPNGMVSVCSDLSEVVWRSLAENDGEEIIYDDYP